MNSLLIFSHTRQCLDSISGLSTAISVVQDDVFFVKDRVSDLVDCTLRHHDNTKEDLKDLSPILSTLTNVKVAVDKIGMDVLGQKSLLESIPKVINVTVL